jgi:hypothetical protein
VGCARSLDSLVNSRASDGRDFASVLRTKMAISSVLPGEATDSGRAVSS